MAADLRAINPADSNKESVVTYLRGLLEQAEAGKVKSLLAITEVGDCYTHQRINMSYQVAAGMYTRALYLLHKDWDRGV